MQQMPEPPVGRPQPSRIEGLQATIAHAAAELQRLRRFPETDIFDNGTIIIFRRRYNHKPESTVYTYVALKASGLWFTTGGLSNVSWARMIEELSATSTIDIFFVTNFIPFDDAVAAIVKMRVDAEVPPLQPQDQVREAAQQQGFQFRSEPEVPGVLISPDLTNQYDKEPPF